MKKYHNKLVRDNIPTIIQNNDKKCKIRYLNDSDYLIELKKKLVEEAKEVQSASNKKEIIEELADVYEIISYLKQIYHISEDELSIIKENKADKNGRFENKIYLEYVESEDD